MPASPATHEKPYNRCIDCNHIGVRCDGPDFLAMEIPRLCEWSRLRKDHLHRNDPKWTNAYIAEESKVSKTTVDRFFTGKLEDLNFTTAARIIRVLINGTWGQYPCAMAADQESPDHTAVVEQCRQLQTALDSIGEHHRAEINAIRAESQETITLLKNGVAQRDKLLNERYDFLKMKDRAIAALSILLSVAVVAIIAALVVDRLNTDIGFFWVNGETNHFGAFMIGVLLVLLGVAAIALPVYSILKAKKKSPGSRLV